MRRAPNVFDQWFVMGDHDDGTAGVTRTGDQFHHFRPCGEVLAERRLVHHQDFRRGGSMEATESLLFFAAR